MLVEERGTQRGETLEGRVLGSGHIWGAGRAILPDGWRVPPPFSLSRWPCRQYGSRKMSMDKGNVGKSIMSNIEQKGLQCYLWPALL